MTSSSGTPSRKFKIHLQDYPYRRDIEIRLFCSHLSVIEINVLREIIHHSLKFSVDQLAEDVDLSLQDLFPILDKLSVSKLFTQQQMMLVVDKEKRKYFESQIVKFDEDFRPDLDYFQTLLNKVPMHTLLNWYAIPRTSDNIFESIKEKYFLTPQIYRQYLHELQFDDPILPEIIQKIFESPQLMMRVDDLKSHFQLTHEKIEEYLLLLEYHFICCLNYQQIDGRWEEIITPFAEWKEYLQFESQTKPQPIPEISILKDQSVKFAFIQDLATLLTACQSKKVAFNNIKNLHTKDPDQKSFLIHTLNQLEFVNEHSSGEISITESGKKWLSKTLYEQIGILANDLRNTLALHDCFSSLWNGRNLRLIEKNLKCLSVNEWIEMDSFLEYITAPIGDKEQVALKNKRKKWRYALPSYTENDRLFIQAVLTERLARFGIIDTGSFKGKKCFCLTPFGSHFLH